MPTTDPGLSILSLPLTTQLADLDVMPFARPSGTSAPGSNLGVTAQSLKTLFGNSANLTEAAFLLAYADKQLGTYAGKLLFITARPAGAGPVAVAVNGSGSLASDDAYLFDATNPDLQAAPVTVAVVNGALVTSPRSGGAGGSTLWSATGPAYTAGQFIHNSAGQQFRTTQANASHGTEPVLPLSTALAAFYRFVGPANTNEVPEGANNLYFTTARRNEGLAAVATTGSYNDLANKPAIPALGADLSFGFWNPNRNLGEEGNGLDDSLAYPKGYYVQVNETGAPKTVTVASAVNNNVNITVSAIVLTGVGLSVSGAGIPANTRIFSVISPTQIRLTVAVTIAAGTVLTISPLFAGFTNFVQGDLLIFNGLSWQLRPGMVRTDAGGDTFSVLPYAASIAVDFNAETVRTLAATGNVAFAASVNVALLKTKELYLTNTTGAAITLSCPAGWSFFPGPAPTTLAAGKQAVLTLRSLGTTDSTVKAAYVAQA